MTQSITGALMDTLAFRRMISPFILQLLFWAGIAGTLYGAWVLYTLDNRPGPSRCCLARSWSG